MTKKKSPGSSLSDRIEMELSEVTYSYLHDIFVVVVVVVVLL